MDMRLLYNVVGLGMDVIWWRGCVLMRDMMIVCCDCFSGLGIGKFFFWRVCMKVNFFMVVNFDKYCYELDWFFFR